MHSSFERLDLPTNKLIYKEKLTEAKIINRPNRYVAVVELQDGTVVRAHTPVGGRIGGLTLDGLPCLISGPYEGRATDYTVQAIGLQATTEPDFQWIGINQGAANAYTKEFMLAGLLPNLTPGITAANGAEFVKPEKKLGTSRIDFFVGAPNAATPELWIEVKTPLIKLHTAIPESVPIKTDFGSDSVGARMPKQMNDLFSQLPLGKRVVLLAAFIYENTLKTSDELKLKDNLDLDGLITKGRALGLESWQVTYKIDAEGVELRSYQRLF
jgi:DNA-binding sugar fermentation-stimulating protein